MAAAPGNLHHLVLGVTGDRGARGDSQVLVEVRTEDREGETEDREVLVEVKTEDKLVPSVVGRTEDKKSLVGRTEERQYQCDWCNKQFGIRVKLKHHMNIHLVLRPYACTVCGKTFTQSTHLSVHRR